jgi:hypothetical protein
MIDMCKQPLCTVQTAPTILNSTQPHAPHPRLSFHSSGSVIARLLRSIDPALVLLFDNSTCFASPNNIHSHTLPRDFHDHQPTTTCGVTVTHTLAPPATTTRAKKRHRHCFSRSVPVDAHVFPLLCRTRYCSYEGQPPYRTENRETCRTNQRHLL